MNKKKGIKLNNTNVQDEEYTPTHKNIRIHPIDICSNPRSGGFNRRQNRFLNKARLFNSRRYLLYVSQVGWKLYRYRCLNGLGNPSTLQATHPDGPLVKPACRQRQGRGKLYWGRLTDPGSAERMTPKNSIDIKSGVNIYSFLLPYPLLFGIISFIFMMTLPGCNRNMGKDASTGDHALLDKVQEQTFNYFWEGGEPVSGGARERIHMDDVYPTHPKDIITSGGTGFGIMATLVGIERGFITREEGFERLLKLTNWLDKSDRFHGAWPHWWMPDGKMTPFSKYDNGGDLVETSFLVQGLLAARQYFRKGNTKEQELAEKMDELWRGVDWEWYTRGENVLYWHWSPEYGWKMNFAVHGYNECLIMYILAASSPTHGVDPAVYKEGFMMDGKIVSNDEYYGLPVILNHYGEDDKMVGPLFWAHYSYLGLDPHGLKDQYADFWKLNQNHALIQYRYCIDNPKGYEGYSDSCWGLTSSYSIKGYAGHSPEKDLGVISPTAALSSFPYTPDESDRFLHFLYDDHPELIGEYGPYDAFSLDADWFTPRYLAIDQLPIPVMIENYRSELLWDLFMSAPEIQDGLDKLGFEYRKREAY